MPGSPPDLELRPRPLVEAFARRFGETAEEARRRLLTAALPAAAVPLFVLGARSYRSMQEHGVVQELVGLTVAVALVAALLVVMALAHARQRIWLEGDELVVRTLWRTRRHPRALAHRAESSQLRDVSHMAPATWVLDQAGRCLVAMSWVQFERLEVERLLVSLGVPHEERLDEVLSLGQMRRRYPGAFAFSRRHPVITGVLALLAILAAIVAFAIVQTR